jgi:hypothetical protein
VRLTIALPRAVYNTEGLQAFTELLIQRSRRGLEQDRLIWENLNREVPPAWTREDATVQEFYRFCQTFLKRDPIGSRQSDLT